MFLHTSSVIPPSMVLLLRCSGRGLVGTSISVKVSFDGSRTAAMSHCPLSCSPAVHGWSSLSALSHTLPWLPFAACSSLNNSWHLEVFSQEKGPFLFLSNLCLIHTRHSYIQASKDHQDLLGSSAIHNQKGQGIPGTLGQPKEGCPAMGLPC